MNLCLYFELDGLFCSQRVTAGSQSWPVTSDLIMLTRVSEESWRCAVWDVPFEGREVDGL